MALSLAGPETTAAPAKAPECDHPAVWMVDIASRRVVRATCPLCAPAIGEGSSPPAAAATRGPAAEYGVSK